MVMFIHPFGSPFELDYNHDDVRILSLVALIAVSLLVIVFTGFYAFVYSHEDSTGCPEIEEACGTGGRNRWFQPFGFLRESVDAPSDWLGECSSDCPCSSSDSEIGDTSSSLTIDIPPMCPANVTQTKSLLIKTHEIDP